MLKLQILDEYYRSRRQRGHSTAVLEGAANNNNIRVIIGNHGQRNFNLPSEQLIPVGEMNWWFRGSEFPVVVDNLAINIMWEEVRKELLKKDDEIAMLKEQFSSIVVIAKEAIKKGGE